MYVTPELCFLVGLGIGILGTLVAVVGIAVYLDSKKEK